MLYNLLSICCHYCLQIHYHNFIVKYIQQFSCGVWENFCTNDVKVEHEINIVYRGNQYGTVFGLFCCMDTSLNTVTEWNSMRDNVVYDTVQFMGCSVVWVPPCTLYVFGLFCCRGTSLYTVQFLDCSVVGVPPCTLYVFVLFCCRGTSLYVFVQFFRLFCCRGTSLYL